MEIICARMVNCVKPYTETSCRTSKVPQNSGEQGEARAHLLRTSFFPSKQLSAEKKKSFAGASGKGPRQKFRMTEKGGLSLRGDSLHDGFGGFDDFGGSGEHLALRSLVLQNTGQRGNIDGFDGFGGFGGDGYLSEPGRIRFRRARFQTPNSVSFFGLTEFRGPNSVSSFRPIICVQTRTQRVSRRTHRVCRRTQ